MSNYWIKSKGYVKVKVKDDVSFEFKNDNELKTRTLLNFVLRYQCYF